MTSGTVLIIVQFPKPVKCTQERPQIICLSSWYYFVSYISCFILLSLKCASCPFLTTFLLVSTYKSTAIRLAIFVFILITMVLAISMINMHDFSCLFNKAVEPL
jgi:hypothetical protein